MKKNVTIQDIAQAAGCSKTTVSRFLNGQTNMMSAETASRIANIINLLDYRPSDLARSLKTKRSYTIGIVIADIASPFATSVVVGSCEVLEERGYIPLFIHCHEDAAKEARAISSLTSKGVDGLIVNTTSPDNQFLYDCITKGIPVVLCDRALRQYRMDLVEQDNEQIITMLVRHLQEQGYTRLALFTQRNVLSSAKDIRETQFLKCMADAFQANAAKDIYAVAALHEAEVGAALAQFMGTVKPGEIPAVIGANTILTMLLYRSIKNAGYQMPQDLGLCGTNGWSWGESVTWMDLLRPTVTCVTMDGYELGRQCARRILERIEHPGDPVEHIKIDVHLEPRGSTARN